MPSLDCEPLPNRPMYIPGLLRICSSDESVMILASSYRTGFVSISRNSSVRILGLSEMEREWGFHIPWERSWVWLDGDLQDAHLWVTDWTQRAHDWSFVYEFHLTVVLLSQIDHLWNKTWINLLFTQVDSFWCTSKSHKIDFSRIFIALGRTNPFKLIFSHN